jgi:hypothetical protein
MNVKVFNDGEEVFCGSLAQFLDDNDNEEWLTEECEKLKNQNYVEMSLFHSGEWRIEKL